MAALLTALGITVMHCLTVWGAYYNPQLSTSTSLGVPTVVAGFRFALPVATALAIVGRMFAILREPLLRRLKLFLIWLTAVAVLLGGVLISDGLLSWYEEQEAVAHGLPPGRIHATDRAAVYAKEQEGTSYTDVVLFRKDRQPRFSVHEEAHLNPFEKTIRIPEAGVSIPAEEVAHGYAGLFEPPALLARFFGDIRITAKRLLNAGPSTGNESLALIASLCLVTVSGWFLIRLTRWPVLNGFLVLLLLRGVLFLFRAGSDTGFTESVSGFLGVSLGAFLVPALLTAISAVLLGLSALLPPFREWQRDVTHE
jgi:hypothetical protein